jgi:hypothetical protein
VLWYVNAEIKGKISSLNILIIKVRENVLETHEDITHVKWRQGESGKGFQRK